MTKKVLRITESELYGLIHNTVNRILKEDFDVDGNPNDGVSDLNIQNENLIKSFRNGLMIHGRHWIEIKDNYGEIQVDGYDDAGQHNDDMFLIKYEIDNNMYLDYDPSPNYDSPSSYFQEGDWNFITFEVYVVDENGEINNKILDLTDNKEILDNISQYFSYVGDIPTDSDYRTEYMEYNNDIKFDR